MCIHEKQMFPCRNNFCKKYVKGVISDLYKITKYEIQTKGTKRHYLWIIILLLIQDNQAYD